MRINKLLLAGTLLLSSCAAKQETPTVDADKILADSRDATGETLATESSGEPQEEQKEPEKIDDPNRDLFKSVHDLDKERVKNALADGADINAIDGNGHTALMIAIHSNDKDFVSFLFEKNADANVQREGGMTSLMAAAYYSDLDMVKLFVKHGADIFGHNQFGQNAISFAHERNEEVFIFLLRKLGVSRKKIDDMIENPDRYYITDKPPYVRRVAL